MTPPGPLSIEAYFAAKAPVCVILRRGPSRYAHMILWHTDTDLFLPGQWVKGRVHSFTMTSDGMYAAMGIMGSRSRIHSWEDTHVSVVCRPPFFTALEVVVDGMCMSGAQFLVGDRLMVWGRDHRIYAPNPCPFERVYEWPPGCVVPNVIHAPARQAGTGVDQRGREILIDNGHIFAIAGGELRLLFDCNAFVFGKVVAPDWAKQW